MASHLPHHYRCPLCQQALLHLPGMLQCENKHCFDIAKEGYINLLPVHKKRSQNPGDSTEMIRSRQRFLDAAYYQALSKKLKDLIEKHLHTDGDNAEAKQVLDIGCGEGYYLAQLIQSTAENNPSPFTLSACDIAKPAARLAAKRVKSASICVASAYDLPYFDQQFDLIYSVFSPFSIEENFRILKPGGIFIAVGPGEHHLQALAEQIYEQAQTHKGNFNEIDTAERFTCIAKESLRYEIHVQHPHIPDLLTMTPYYWSCSEEKKAKLYAQTTLSTELEFDLRVYQSQSPNS